VHSRKLFCDSPVSEARGSQSRHLSGPVDRIDQCPLFDKADITSMNEDFGFLTQLGRCEGFGTLVSVEFA
jgi:hypothetical protein